MKLMSVDDFFDKYFSNKSRPSEATRRRWLRKGAIAGARKIAGSWFVDEHAWLADGDPLVEHVLQAG